MLELDGLRCRTDQDIIVGPGDNALGLGAADTSCVGCTQCLHQGKGTCGDEFPESLLQGASWMALV